MNEALLDSLITLMMKEDLGDGDHTSLACIPRDKTGKASLIVKQNGILAGVEVARRIFKKYNQDINLIADFNDGAEIKQGDIVFTVEGPQISILQAERPVLNVMQHMSGIATQTRKYADKLKGYKAKLLDTRKTTPGMRILDKAAVKIGGGENHRFGLFDMIMLKDNHIDYAGGIAQAIKKVRSYLEKNKKNLKIEIEARNLEELKIILATGGVHRIMLDNFSIPDTKEAVRLIAGKYEVESSGGINLQNIQDYAACGVDYISVGALTHHIQSLDLSLKAI
ncbi:MAG: carboxylating nicotinate-nucleotide diphosphorylase [Bacteroidia bacterium]|nr:carboxylating nicotinate-nucleotide diphosphorylase [Bacteroidia bacterium]